MKQHSYEDGKIGEIAAVKSIVDEPSHQLDTLASTTYEHRTTHDQTSDVPVKQTSELKSDSAEEILSAKLNNEAEMEAPPPDGHGRSQRTRGMYCTCIKNSFFRLDEIPFFDYFCSVLALPFLAALDLHAVAQKVYLLVEWF